MFYGLYISAEGARAQSERLQVIANNLANVDTTGFKRDLAIFQSRYSEATQRGMDSPGSGTINDMGGGVLFRETVTSFVQGPLERTDMPSDLAIEGEGFFVVRQGNRDYLTRAGNFVVKPDGDVVTADGYSVLNADREPLHIAAERGPYRFTEDGAVEQPGTKTFLALVKPRSFGDLAKVGEYLYEPLAPVDDLEPGKRQVRSGFLEKSVVRPASEMMQLIETSRVFEANVHLIQNQDQMFGALISRVLRAA
jgi:flagellar basal-body rod protein FlgF/flagellar basal-body rod protein FlgG